MKRKNILKYAGTFTIVMFFLIMPASAGVMQVNTQNNSVINDTNTLLHSQDTDLTELRTVLSRRAHYPNMVLEIEFSDEPENYEITIEPGNDAWAPDRVSYVFRLPVLNEDGNMNTSTRCTYVYFSLLDYHNYYIHGESWYKREGKPVHYNPEWFMGMKWRGGIYTGEHGVPRLLRGWHWVNTTLWYTPERVVEYHHVVCDYDEDGEFMEIYNENLTRFTEPPEDIFVPL